MEERGGEHEPLTHPEGVALREVVSEFPEFEIADLRGDPFLGGGFRHPEHVGDEPQELTARQLLVEARLVGDVAEVKMGGPRIPDEVVPGDLHGASRWPQQADEHLDRRRLPSAIGAEEGKQLPARNRQIEARHGELLAVRARHPFEGDHGDSPPSAAAGRERPAGESPSFARFAASVSAAASVRRTKTSFRPIVVAS